MNYEEKYKNALRRAKKLYEQGTITECLGWVFPEIKESANEEIRKAIMACCSDHGHKYKWTGITTQDMLYWLGKQGNCKGQVNLPCFTFDDILALQCCMETVSKVQEDKVLYEKLKGLHSRVYDAYQLEKARRE